MDCLNLSIMYVSNSLQLYCSSQISNFRVLQVFYILDPGWWSLFGDCYMTWIWQAQTSGNPGYLASVRASVCYNASFDNVSAPSPFQGFFYQIGAHPFFLQLEDINIIPRAVEGLSHLPERKLDQHFSQQSSSELQGVTYGLGILILMVCYQWNVAITHDNSASTNVQLLIHDL